jgi:hypothetical protein
MSIQLSVATRNGRLDSIESTIGTSPKLQIRTGTVPANCAASDEGTLLVEITCPSNWMADASSGSKVLAGTWTGTAVATGVAAHFRIKNSGGSTCHIQGTVTGLGGGGDLVLDNPSIISTQTVNVLTFTLTDANA